MAAKIASANTNHKKSHIFEGFILSRVATTNQAETEKRNN